MGAPKGYRFTETHEWVRREGDVAYVGLSDHAQDELGDIVFVELPETGRKVVKGEEVTTIESVKAAGQIYAPVSGTIESVNGDLDEKPESINEAPYEVFIFTIKMDDPGQIDGLLDEEGYLAVVENGD